MTTWLWRLAFVVAIAALLIVSTTEKSDDTIIEPCALVLDESGHRCR